MKYTKNTFKVNLPMFWMIGFVLVTLQVSQCPITFIKFGDLPSDIHYSEVHSYE